jgi:hypothetical protein
MSSPSVSQRNRGRLEQGHPGAHAGSHRRCLGTEETGADHGEGAAGPEAVLEGEGVGQGAQDVGRGAGQLPGPDPGGHDEHVVRHLGAVRQEHGAADRVHLDGFAAEAGVQVESVEVVLGTQGQPVRGSGAGQDLFDSGGRS